MLDYLISPEAVLCKLSFSLMPLSLKQNGCDARRRMPGGVARRGRAKAGGGRAPSVFGRLWGERIRGMAAFAASFSLI